MSKDQKKTKKRNVETVDNFREYFNENFETIEMNIKTARDFQFILERIEKHLSKNKFPENLYRQGIISIINWITVSIDLHYRNQESLINLKK